MSLLLLLNLQPAEEGTVVEGFDYSGFVAMAVEMLERYGQSGKLVRPTYTGPKHTPVLGVPVLYDAVFVTRSFKRREIDGSRILATDRLAIISPDLEVDPKTSDLLQEANGGKFRIVDFDTIRPATTTIAYIAQVRR